MTLQKDKKSSLIIRVWCEDSHCCIIVWPKKDYIYTLNVTSEIHTIKSGRMISHLKNTFPWRKLFSELFFLKTTSLENLLRHLTYWTNFCFVVTILQPFHEKNWNVIPWRTDGRGRCIAGDSYAPESMRIISLKRHICMHEYYCDKTEIVPQSAMQENNVRTV